MLHAQGTPIDRNPLRTSTGNIVWLVGAVAVCMLTSCGFSSVSPFVSSTDVASDPRLVGTWSNSEEKESAVIVRDGDGYNIRYADSDGKVGRFHGVLGRLGSRQVLDVLPVFPDDLPGEKSDLYLSLLVPTHGILILELGDRQLTIRGLDAQEIDKLLKERPALVAHNLVPSHFEPKSNDVVLTASTADVRKFLSEIIDRPGVLGDPESWRRK